MADEAGWCCIQQHISSVQSSWTDAFSLSDLCLVVIPLPCILIYSHVSLSRPACLSVLGATWKQSGTPPPSVTADTPMWWRAKYQGCCHFRRWRSCCWHQPALSKAACVKECLLLRYFHNHILFSTSTHGGILPDVPRRLSHAPLDTNVDKYWACCPDLHSRTPSSTSSLPPPPQNKAYRKSQPCIHPSIQQILEIIGIFRRFRNNFGTFPEVLQLLNRRGGAWRVQLKLLIKSNSAWTPTPGK